MVHEATRTLVKSPPEIWEQCSDPESLSRHLNGSFGEIRITRLEPESTVAWEGERGSGTVTIEPSAWGTRVTLIAHTEGEGPEAEEEQRPEPPQPSPEPPQTVMPVAREREPLIRLVMRLWRRRVVAAPAVIAPEPDAREPETAPAEGGHDQSSILMAALESMGQAHHRPYSRG